MTSYFTLRRNLCAAFSLAVFAAPAFASQEEDIAALTRALKEQSALIKTQREALKAQEEKIETEAAQLNALRAKLEALSGQKIILPQEVAQKSVDAGAQAKPSAGATPSEVGTDRKPATPDHPPEVAKYIEEGGVLLPKGKMVLTPSLEYDRLSSTNVAIEGFSVIPAINIGLFDINQVSRDTLIGAMDARLGVTNRFEIEAKVPYVYGTQSTLGRPVGAGASSDSLASIDGDGIGDVEVAGHYQINKGQNQWPYLIGNLRFKTETGTGPFQIPQNGLGLQDSLPTGTGFYALQPSLTAIYPVDPVVFYGNIGYVHNFERSFPVYGKIQPGDTISASFGMSTALNDAASFSLGYSQDVVAGTKQNGQSLPGSRYLEIGSVDIGWSYILNDRVSLNLNVSAGVTSDAPDDRVILRVPVAFDVF
jgi:hypothetical protein